MEGNLLRATKGGQRGNKGCLLLVLLCLQSPPSVTLPYLSLAGRRQELATAWNAVVLTVAWPACWGLLASIMRGQAPPEQLPTGQSSSSFLRRRPTSMSAVTLTIDSVTVAIATLVESHSSILMITETISIGNGAQGPKWMLA